MDIYMRIRPQWVNQPEYPLRGLVTLCTLASVYDMIAGADIDLAIIRHQALLAKAVFLAKSTAITRLDSARPPAAMARNLNMFSFAINDFVRPISINAYQ